MVDNREWLESAEGKKAVAEAARKQAGGKGKGAGVQEALGGEGIGYNLPASTVEASMALLNKLGPIGKAIEQTVKRYDRWNVAIQKVGAQTKEQARTITGELIKFTSQHADLGISMTDANKAMTAAMKNYGGVVTKGWGKDYMAVTKQIAVYDKLGVGASQVTDMMNLFGSSLGMNSREMAGFGGIINKFAVDTGQEFSKAWQDINQNVGSFMTIVDSKKMLSQTLAMSATARRMGLSVNQMMGSLQQFETLEGAQQAAGKINAVMGSLGGSFDAVKAAGMDFTERQKYIASTIKGVYGRIEQSGPRAGRAYIGALADAFGMDARTIKAMATAQPGAALPAEVMAGRGLIGGLTTAETQRAASEAATWEEREQTMKEVREALIYRGLMPLADKLKEATGKFDSRIATGAEKFSGAAIDKFKEFFDKQFGAQSTATGKVTKAVTDLDKAAVRLGVKAKALGMG